MDPPDNIKQVNADIKEYDKKLVSVSNINLDYIVDKKLGHYCYNYVTRDFLSDFTEENPTQIIQIQVTMNKIFQGGGDGIYPRHNTYDNIHWFHINNKALNYFILIYNQTFLVMYMVLLWLMIL